MINKTNTVATTGEKSDRVNDWTSIASIAQRYFPVVFLLLSIPIILVVGIIEPIYWSRANALNLMRQASILSLLVWGQAVATISGGIDLSVAAVAALSGVVFAITASLLGTWLSIPVALAVAALVGLLNGLAIAYLLVPAFVATLAMRLVGYGVALFVTGGVAFYSVPPDFDRVAATNVVGVPLPFIITVLFLVGAFLLLYRTPLGRHIYGVGTNQQAAKLNGVNVARTRIAAHVISGICAGTAGIILASRVSSGQPAAAGGLELEALSAVILGGISLFGGRGHILGAASGLAFILILTNALNFLNVSPYLRMIAVGSALLLAVGVDVSLRGDQRKI